MKRGVIEISQELLKELLKERIPPDFKLSGVEFVTEYNVIKLHGYSEEFHETFEGNMHMNEANDGWIPLPLKELKVGEYTFKDLGSKATAKVEDDYAPAPCKKYKGYGTVRNLDGIKKPWWKFW